MTKVSIIGAGNVGATAAMKIATMDFTDEIVLLDIKEGVAEGKAMDIMQCSIAENFLQTKITGVTNDYSATENSNVIVVTSGVPRKPGMTREDLVGINSRIVADVVEKCDQYSPNACYIIVSNPMDTMTFHAINTLNKLHPDKNFNNSVIGMGNLLDSSRFRYFIWKKLNEVNKNINIGCIFDSWVVGGHGDTTMIPIIDMANVFDGTIKPLKDLLSDEDIAEIVNNTMKGGSILTNLLGTSAWEAPGSCIALTVHEILNPTNIPIPCSIYREDLGCCIGTLCYLNNGITSYHVESEISEDLSEKIKISAEAIKKVNSVLQKN